MQGIRVTTEVAIDDPNGLGHHIAGMTSNHQAAILGGFARGIEDLGSGPSGMQVQWIVDSLCGMSSTRQTAVIRLLSSLLVAVGVDEPDPVGGEGLMPPAYRPQHWLGGDHSNQTPYPVVRE
jgi:hypothetical protein